MTHRILKVIEESKAARAREEKKAAAFFAVRHGSSRTTFLIGPLAIKVPSLRLLRRGQTPAQKRERLWRAIVGNLTERATWNLTKASFLAPTYLSLGGLVNIAKRARGSPASRDTILAMLQIFRVEADHEALGIDGHSFYADGDWLYTGDGYILTDYGDAYGSGRPISGFIAQNQKVLERALGPAKNTPD